MRPIESKLIKKFIYKYIANDDLILKGLDIGSSTLAFRTKIKPHIYENIYVPLISSNKKLYTSDLKQEIDNDFSGDIFDSDFFNLLKKQKFDFLFCFNVLEHVESPKAFINRCVDFLPSGSLVFVSVPFSYPHHNDPIDTLFRPSPSELSGIVTNSIQLDELVIVDDTFIQDLLRLSFTGFLSRFLSELLKFGYDLVRFKFLILRQNRLFWLFRPYKISFVVLKKL